MSAGGAGRVAVFGIGNVLIGDDAAGPTVIAYLQATYSFPEDLVIEDLGTPCLDFTAWLADFDSIIFIDAVDAQFAPGTIRTYTLEEILRHPPGLRISPHDPSLKETLLTSRFATGSPRYARLVGIVPASTERFGLSEAVQAAVPHAAQAVVDELAALGVVAEPKLLPQISSPWWTSARTADIPR